MIHELRNKMLDHQIEMETASAEWRRIRDKLDREHGIDAAFQRDKSRPLKDAFNATAFHRDMAASYAAMLSAEILYQTTDENPYDTARFLRARDDAKD